MEEDKSIKKILKELKFYKLEVDDFSVFKNVSVRNFDPPAYIVRIIFLWFLNFENYGEITEKVTWATSFEYKKHLFLVRDYKFGSWSIECSETGKEIDRTVKDLKEKILKAAKVVDRALYKYLETQVKSENFYLSNVYQKLSSIYTFYENRTRKTIKEYEKFSSKKTENNENFTSMNVIKREFALREKILYNLFPLILAFFSILEFILDVLYAFERPQISYEEYKKKKRWDERFKIVLDVNKNKDLKSVFDDLLSIKNNYRNPLAHGLTNEVNLLVSLPHIGLIPLSYEYLSNDLHFGSFGFNKDMAATVLETFDKFFNFLEKNEPYFYYMLYLSYPFPIPFSKEEIYKIKKFMTSRSDFIDYLRIREQFEELVINRDI